ncbi:hypothetical protein KI387_043691 [Taxus chinensis]|uniref:Uncharacterized protein n=1 Tax=Taxus chinensis TaxID=29808 RepID=A0AA38H215_TAXCH|nr:hypothetical protein KI387_043691 [Taxus chinensis]
MDHSSALRHNLTAQLDNVGSGHEDMEVAKLLLELKYGAAISKRKRNPIPIRFNGEEDFDDRARPRIRAISDILSSSRPVSSPWELI